MKRKFCLVILSVVFVGSLMSQISIRPQIGFNAPSISADDISGNLGYQFGADIQFGKTFFIQPGLNFQTDKLSIKNAGDMDLSSINIPLMFGISLFKPVTSSIGIRAFAGPNLSFQVSKNLDDVSSSDLMGDNFKNAVFSGQFGAGIDLGILFVDLAYQFGLSDYLHGSNQFEDSKNNKFIGNAGIRIGF